MKLSTPNQLAGTVTSITEGEAMALVEVELAGGQVITSSITRAAVTDLELSGTAMGSRRRRVPGGADRPGQTGSCWTWASPEADSAW